MLELARRIRSLDDLQTIVDGGLSPTRLAGMSDAILMRLGQPPTAAALEWQDRSLLELGARAWRRAACAAAGSAAAPSPPPRSTWSAKDRTAISRPATSRPCSRRSGARG
jgi:hypothetical protein